MSQLDKLPPSKKQSLEKPLENDEKKKKKFELLKGTSVKRQVLVTSPITIAKNGMDTQYKNIPAAFFVLRETDAGLYEIGDEKGESNGFIEKEEVIEWNTRLVWKPKSGELVEAFDTAMNANAAAHGEDVNPKTLLRLRSGMEYLFPILEHGTGKLRSAVLIGKPIEGDIEGEFPMWIQKKQTEIGVLATKNVIDDVALDLDLIIRKLQRNVDSGDRPNDHIATIVGITLWRLVTSQELDNAEGLQEMLGPIPIMTRAQLQSLPLSDLERAIQSYKGKLKSLQDIAQKNEHVTSLFSSSNKEGQLFIPLSTIE